MRRRRFFGAGAGGLAGVMGLAATTTACGTDSEGQVVLKLLATEYGGEASDAGTTERYWNEVVNEFREEFPDILINVSTVRYQDAYEEVARLAREGTPPDIAQITSFAEFAAADQLYAASELLTIPVLADFVPSIATAGERRRIQYGIPFASTITRLFYNRQLFRDAGLNDERGPRDRGELLDAALALRSAGVTTPLVLPFVSHYDTHAEAAAWMISGGGGLTDDTGSYTIDVQENADTFAWLRDELVGQDLCGPKAPDRTTRADAYAAFAAGTAAMIAADSLLLRQAEIGGIDFDTAPMPGPTAPSPTALGQAVWVLGFNHSGRREEIAAFLDFVYTNTTVASFSDRYDTLPVTSAAAQTMSENSDPEDESLAPFLGELPGATFYPVGKVSWAEVSRTIGLRIGETLRPGADIAAILGEIQSQAEAADRREDAV